jgi:uncharacterized protein
MQFSGFDWDEGNWPKCGKHGVSKEEIESLLLSTPLVLPDRTPGLSETRYNAVGLNEEGRHLFVVLTLRDSNGQTFARPISARYMHEKESDRYEQTRET